MRDISVKQDFATSTQIENSLSLEIILSGTNELNMNGRQLSNKGMPRVYLSSHKHNGNKVRVHRAGDKLRSISLLLSPFMLTEKFGLKSEQLPEKIRNILLMQDDSVVTLALPTKVKGILLDVFESKFSGQLAEQYLNAKVIEILCHMIPALTQPESTFQDDQQISRKKSEIISKVLITIHNDLSAIPTLNDLASSVGVCQSTLSTTFKHSVGIPLSEYIAHKKMETARCLLRKGRMSVLDVSLAVGYDDQSGFGRAYKRYFNCTPKDDKPSLHTSICAP